MEQMTNEQQAYAYYKHQLRLLDDYLVLIAPREYKQMNITALRLMLEHDVVIRKNTEMKDFTGFNTMSVYKWLDQTFGGMGIQVVHRTQGAAAKLILPEELKEFNLDTFILYHYFGILWKNTTVFGDIVTTPQTNFNIGPMSKSAVVNILKYMRTMDLTKVLVSRKYLRHRVDKTNPNLVDLDLVIFEKIMKYMCRNFPSIISRVTGYSNKGIVYQFNPKLHDMSEDDIEYMIYD